MATVRTRVTVNLSPLAAGALDEIVSLTGDTKTEAINKALQMYALIQSYQSYGGGVWLRADGGESGSTPERVRFL